MHYTPSFATDNGPIGLWQNGLKVIFCTKKFLDGIVPVKGDRNYALHTLLRHRQWSKKPLEMMTDKCFKIIYAALK